MAKTLPQLTPEQRQAALAKGREVRQARAEILRKLKAGGLTLRGLLQEVDAAKAVKGGPEHPAARILVRQLLGALPGVGKVKTDEVMQRVDIKPNRRVQGLGQAQRRKLLDEFDQQPAA